MRPPSDLPIASSPGAPLAEASTAPRTRRAVLAAVVGGLAGSVASALGRPAAVDAAAGGPLVLGQQNYAGSSATRLSATSSGGAFWMTQNGSGSGVRGDSVNGHGGVFTTAHPDRQGLLAQQLGAAGSGAALRADGGANTGVYATSSEGTNPGVRGESWYGSGGHFLTHHANRQGLLAQQLGAAGSGAALRAEGGANWGIYAISSNIALVAISDNGFGVHGGTLSGIGVSGVSISHIGVYGSSTSYIGVYGDSSTSYAGYFAGPCYATSFVGPAAPTVRLDHPLQPATRVLAHAAVVSDAAATLYSGTATTDAAGEATVRLPDWFEALNTDLRYQLTVIGSFAQAIVKSEVADNRFTIATSEPGTKVCWQITGVRRDAYAAAHPLVVESPKTGREKGRYLTPLELGQPESKAVDWEARQRAKTVPAPAPTG